MREIKFRAWDRKNSCWYKPVLKAYRGELFELLISFGGDLTAHTMKGLVHQPDRFILMQYTGLKDKNGKEIYEGDVVVDEYTYNRVGAEDIKNYPALHRIVKWEQVPSDECYDTSGSVGFSLTPEQVYVLIGNIYETPELLESEKQ